MHDVFEAVMGGDAPPVHPRSLVSASWERSLAAHVDPDRHVPPAVLRDAELPDLRSAHPLNEVMPLLRSTLVSIADEAMHVMLVTDADGTILWREGAAKLLHVADSVGLSPGLPDVRGRDRHQRDGHHAGRRRPGADPLRRAPGARTFHAWTCAAAPVHDPDTGAILGAIDISGPLHTVHPAMVQLVSATAQLAENQLRVRLAIADERLRVRNMPHLASLRGNTGALVTSTGRIVAGEPYGVWPTARGDARGRLRPHPARRRPRDGARAAQRGLPAAPAPRSIARRSALSLRFMGAGAPGVVLNGRSIPLTLRPAELLAALALHPEGLTAERLAQLLYGDDGNPTTVRGEILRLRGLIGAEVLRTRPYRLDAGVDSDFAAVRRALRAGKPAEALQACEGPLLPRSDAPEIRELRDELEAGLRHAVLDADDLDLLADYAAHPLGRDDLEVHDRLVRDLPPTDRRRAELESRRARLEAEG